MRLSLLFTISLYISHAMKRPASCQIVLRHCEPEDLLQVDTLIVQLKQALATRSTDKLVDLVKSPSQLEVLEKTDKGHPFYLNLKKIAPREVRFLIAIYEQAVPDIVMLMKLIQRNVLLENMVYLMESLEDRILKPVLELHSDFFAQALFELVKRSDDQMNRIYKRVTDSQVSELLDRLLKPVFDHAYAQKDAKFIPLHLDADLQDKLNPVIAKLLEKFVRSENDEVKKRDLLSIVFKDLILTKSAGMIRYMLITWTDLYCYDDYFVMNLLAKYAGHEEIKSILFEPSNNKHSIDVGFSKATFEVDALKIAYQHNSVQAFMCLHEEALDGIAEEFYEWFYKNEPLANQKKIIDSFASLDYRDWSFDCGAFKFAPMETLLYIQEVDTKFSTSEVLASVLDVLPEDRLKNILDSQSLKDCKDLRESALENDRTDLLHLIAEHPKCILAPEDVFDAIIRNDAICLQIYLDRNEIMNTEAEVNDALKPAIWRLWATDITTSPETVQARLAIQDLLRVHESYVLSQSEVVDPIYGTFKNAIQLSLVFQSQPHDIYLDIVYNIFPELCPLLDKRLKLHSIVQCLVKNANKNVLLQFMSETMDDERILRVLKLLTAYEGNENFLEAIEDPVLKEKMTSVYYKDKIWEL